jgi:hypothetical protein
MKRTPKGWFITTPGLAAVVIVSLLAGMFLEWRPRVNPYEQNARDMAEYFSALTPPTAK